MLQTLIRDFEAGKIRKVYVELAACMDDEDTEMHTRCSSDQDTESQDTEMHSRCSSD